MRAGYVFTDLDNQVVLCLKGDGIELLSLEEPNSLNKAICLKSRTEMRNIQEKFKEKGLIDGLQIVNIGALYKRFF